MKNLTLTLAIFFGAQAHAAPKAKTLSCQLDTDMVEKQLSPSKDGSELNAKLEAQVGEYRITAFASQPLPGSLAKHENVTIVIKNTSTGMQVISGHFLATRVQKDVSQAFVQFVENSDPARNGALVIGDCELKN